MSIRRGNKIIASRISNGFSLFDCKWADHILNNISWLRADTFSWQSGDVYKAAYEHLLDDFENRVGKGTDTDGWLSETIDGVTVLYVVAPDGHKICVHDNEVNVQSLYEKTGVAWYYIIDLANKQFKLPRTKFGFTGIRNGVGGYVEPGLPNITGAFTTNGATAAASAKTGAFYNNGGGNNSSTGGGISGQTNGYGFNASSSNPIYGNSDTVQPQATEMYLYFYVGNYVEDLTTIDAGKLTEVVNDFDIDTFKPQVDEIKNEAISDINQTTSDSVAQLKNMGEVVNYTNITNCITEIPQDIKLELSGGALVLKAGSKLYVPNGFESDGVTLKFNVKNINSDLIRETVVNGKKMSLALYKNSDGGFLQIYELPYTSLCSGPTDSLSGVAYHAWYDTTNNIIKYYGADGTTNNYHAAFPLCFVTGTESGGAISIDQVFNGFGYIGSTVFALPGVKGLIPNGRNPDGTLKNIEFTTDHVSTVTNQSSLSIDLWYSIGQSGNIANSLTDYWKYDYEKNGWFHGTDRWPDIPFASSHVTGGKISDFSSKLVLRSVDYSDFKPVQDHSVIEFQAPTSANNYTWYRKYADGWVEQGGLTNTNTVYTLPVTMRDANYYVSVTWDGGKSANFYPADFQVRNLTTTSFTTTASRNGTNVQGRCWEVKGMYAQ